MLRSVGFAFLMLLSQIGAATEERMEHDYYKYHPMTEITSWMEQIVREHSSLVSTVVYGKTFENRTISLLKIGERTSGVAKKAIWMDCGIHAREWIAPAFCQYFVREILEAYNKTDGKMREMMKNVDFYVTPVLNVDGYIYSWKDNTTRLWRKTRSPGPEDCVCFGDGGTDLNRNFDALWGTVGMSRNCCSLLYAGAGPLSEPESQAVTEFVGSRKADILCFLTIHSYGQMVLVPYGHPNIISPNHNELMEVGLAAADAIREVHGTSYTVGISHDILYPHSGLSMDWARLVGIPFSFCFELRDKGQHGFELPEEQVRATCEEAYAGVLHIVRHVHDKIFCPSGAVAITATTTTLWTTLLVAAWVTGCTTAL